MVPQRRSLQTLASVGVAFLVLGNSDAKPELTKCVPNQQSSSKLGISEPDSGSLLYSRETTRRLLGDISIAYLKRLEANGDLTPVRLNKRSATAQVFYRHKQVLALAKAESVDASTDSDGI